MYHCFTFDLETTSLKRDSEIVQLSCLSTKDKETYFNKYAVPEGSVAASASKVNNLSTAFKDGKKVLRKDGKTVAQGLSSKQVVTDFLTFLEGQKDTNETKIVLIAHNGERFDFTVFINSINKYSLVERAKQLDLWFLDSLKVLRNTTCNAGKKVSMSLSSIHLRLFNQEFDAHDAYCDCEALSKLSFFDQKKAQK